MLLMLWSENWVGITVDKANEMRHSWIVVLFAILPEIAIWVGLAVVGLQFMMLSPTYVDIILNTLAVIFIGEIDELVFNVCIHKMMLEGWDEDVKVDIWWEPKEGTTNTAITRNPVLVGRLFRFELYYLLPLTVVVSGLLPFVV